MNYPTMTVAHPSTNIVIEPEKLVDIQKEKKLMAAHFKDMGDVRAAGNLKNNSIFIADSYALTKYDFVLAMDSLGCLVVVPVKKG